MCSQTKLFTCATLMTRSKLKVSDGFFKQFRVAKKSLPFVFNARRSDLSKNEIDTTDEGIGICCVQIVAVS